MEIVNINIVWSNIHNMLYWVSSPSSGSDLEYFIVLYLHSILLWYSPLPHNNHYSTGTKSYTYPLTKNLLCLHSNSVLMWFIWRNKFYLTLPGFIYNNCTNYCRIRCTFFFDLDDLFFTSSQVTTSIAQQHRLLQHRSQQHCCCNCTLHLYPVLVWSWFLNVILTWYH